VTAAQAAQAAQADPTSV
jgi:hypothetical protein